MQVVEKALNGLLVIEPNVFNDERGSFFESFNQHKFNELIGEEISFVQDNHSISKRNVIRGLHLQAPPYAQGKLVRVSSGRVVDFAVDIRKSSPTFGKHFSVELSSENNLMMWIPAGFAHGFSVLEDQSVFLYKCSNIYHKDSEMTLLYNDADLQIDWKVNAPIVSSKDAQGFCLKDFNSPFN